jgi:hypothetical protein
MNNSPPMDDAVRVLHFWHQVEFFIPFDLKQQVMEAHDAEWAVRSWTLDEMRRAGRSLWSPSLPPGRRLTGFDVYMGVFDKSLLAEVTRQVLRADLSEGDAWEQDERGALEGLTCMAKLRTGPAGEPWLDNVSVSTAPWALGRLQGGGGGLAALDFDSFEYGIETLKERLRQFRATRGPAADAGSGTDEGAGASAGPAGLSGAELLALQTVFEEWTGMRTDDGRTALPAIVVRARTVEESPGKPSAGAASGTEQKTLPLDGGTDDDDADDGAAPVEIDILNSFFAKDIARAIASVERGECGAALRDYLVPLPAQQRLDLYGEQGREAILRTLAPGRVPAAHWPDVPAHAMSLMQQFAINSMLDKLATGGVFSVNGPPGTGKTTLLRDVFAELITRRARVLAGLASANDAFAGTVQVDFAGQRCTISRLRDDLAGFEMVVASSNNAAVENLSRDLPKTKSLGRTGHSPWRGAQGKAGIGYLKEVAHNIAARTPKGYAALDADDTPWGLIACALGNSGNRKEFAFRLGADARHARPAPKGFDPEAHQSIWTWREKYRGPGFAAARANFLAAEQAVTQRIAALERYAQLCERLRGHTRESFAADAGVVLAQALQVLDAARVELVRIDQELALCTRQLDSLREEARLMEQGRPSWWLRWLRRAREHEARAALDANARERRDWLVRRRAAGAAHARAGAALAARRQEWDELARQRTVLGAAFPAMADQPGAAALEEPAWQISGFWHDETINRLRSELFVAALGLHEAWLAEVLQKGGGFGGNLVAVSQLLSGKPLQQREHALAIWQSLFMVVPVVSSTFASIASQFRDLGPESLGWLFIDEAGQAVPQAAVGALWRAQRAVVVGDPLQIEPVFTVPIKLIDALAGAARLPTGRPVAPHLTSVQGLADDANALGAWIDAHGTSRWIGSPLRVHRRCVDPMFTIANQIAYDGKMIFFDQDDPAARLPPAASLDLGASAWVDIGGAALDKQVVPEQVALVCRAVVELYLRTGELPALYIISPFRRIKEALIRTLSRREAWPAGMPPRGLRSWCRARIGTVHTFQGKEESLVWMVLGCDAATAGAAAWAAGKPNLLNVALTRAKHRFFLIGDAALWGKLPHFADASAALLPRIDSAVFLRRVRGGAVDTPAAAVVALHAPKSR